MIELAESDQWTHLEWLDAIRQDCQRSGLRDPRQAYRDQEIRAGRRESWWRFWEASYHLRGDSPSALCMARKGDVGPYAPSNVYLATNAQNVRDYYEKGPGRAPRSRGEKRPYEKIRRRVMSLKYTVEYFDWAYRGRHGPNLFEKYVFDDFPY